MKLKLDAESELCKCIFLKIDKVSLSEEYAALGNNLYLDRQLQLAPFDPVKLDGWHIWESDPLSNRSWQWRLNWLSFLSYLIAYHRSTGNDDVLQFAKDGIVSWLDTYIGTDDSYSFEFIWHDHATALRAEQLALFAYYCREYAPQWAKQNREFLDYIEKALTVHGEWLSEDSFYSENTNHGLEQARVLLLLGTIFKGKTAKSWQELAAQRIKSELDFSFTTEGVHVENSPAYHIFVFKVFLGIIKDYPINVLGDLAEQFEKFSAQALGFITQILRPDGTLPPIGDTEQLPTSDAYREMFGHTLEYQHFLYAVSQGKQGLKPSKNNQVYVKSGYAVFRDCWPDVKHFSKAFHIIAKVGCSSRYHHQQDEGHVSIYAGGEDWLIDSGLYNYINNDPVRKYMRGRPGHNVPIVSNARYADEFEHRLNAWNVESYSELNSFPYVCMQLDVMPPVTHQRRLQFDSQTKIIKIADKVSDVEGQAKNITLQWHFPKDKAISIEGYEVTVTSKSGNKLLISFGGASPDGISVVKGKKGDKVLSCISYKANKVEPSQSLRVLFKNHQHLDVVTKFTFVMANEHVAPLAEPALPNVKSFSSLLSGLHDSENPIRNSVMLGDHSSGSELAQLHRDKKLGGVNVLINTPQQGSEAQDSLKIHQLSPWVIYSPLNLSRLTPVTIDDSALNGIACVDLLVVTGKGFDEDEFEKILLLTLPQLLKRMNKGRGVWVANSLAPKCKSLCEAIAQKHEKPLTFVVGLE
ncbi:heparinase II/III family protein [Vreelandella sp. H-I2]